MAFTSRPAQGQAVADTVAAIAALVEYSLAPERANHFLGVPPIRLYDPRGEGVSFCIAEGIGLGQNHPAFASPAVPTAFRDRLAEVFGLKYVEACVTRGEVEGRPSGFFDELGSLAVQIQMGVVFESPTRARTHFGMNSGVWPGLRGFNCTVERTEDGGWVVVTGTWRYYEG